MNWRAATDFTDAWTLILWGLAGLVSYQVPIYAARYVGREAQLNTAWAAAFRDSYPSGILFVCAYMAIGFAVWAVPLFLLVRLTPRFLRLLIWPLQPLAYLGATMSDRVRDARSERAQLRGLYRTEYKGQFPSFRRFRQYMEWLAASNGAMQPGGFAAARDPYDDALVLLGLSRNSTKAEFITRYRDLMRRVHPDQAGPNDIARRVNEAREVIAARKGW